MAPPAAAAMEYSQAPSVMPEVEWELNRANSISIIGNLGRDPITKVTPSGRSVTTMTLACKPSKDATDKDWYDVEAWEELGTRAAQNLQKGSQVLVEGRLRQDKWTDKNTGQERSRLKITAAALAKVRAYGGAGGYSGGGASYAPPVQSEWSEPGAQQPPSGGGWLGGDQTVDAFGSDSQTEPQQATPSSSKDKYLAAWEAYFTNKKDYWDNRLTKKGKQPDFRHKTTREGLWIDSAPEWAAVQLVTPEDGLPPF